MRGRGRGRNNNKDRGTGFERTCCGLSALGVLLWNGAAAAQVTAPGGAIAAPAGSFTTPLGAYGGAPTLAAPPATAAAGEAGTAAAVAPAWLLTPSLELDETYNDNVNLAPKGARQADFITAISPGLKLTGQTSRISLGIDYDPQELLFVRTSPSQVLQQRLTGTGKAELWRQALYVEGSASISQGYVRNTGPIAPTTLTNNSNLQTIYAETVSPYLLQHLGSFADSESRYRFSSVKTSGNTVSGEDTNELRQSLFGGERFGRLGWSLIGDVTKLDREKSATDPFGGLSSKDELLRLDLKYPIYQALSVVGGTGYERITDATLADQPKGVIWNIGLNYQPNELVAATLTYGERFNRTDIEFSAAYNLDPQLHLSAIYTQSIQTGQSQIAGNLNQLILAPNGTLVDARTGLPFNPAAAGTIGSSSPFGLSSGAFIDKTIELDASLTKARDTYSARLYQSKHTGSSTLVTFGGDTGSTGEKILGTSFSWSHQLRPDLSSVASASYYRANFQGGSGRRDNAYSVTLGLTYLLSRTVTTTLSLSRSDLRSNIPTDSLLVDIVMASIRKEF